MGASLLKFCNPSREGFQKFTNFRAEDRELITRTLAYGATYARETKSRHVVSLKMAHRLKQFNILSLGKFIYCLERVGYGLSYAEKFYLEDKS